MNPLASADKPSTAPSPAPEYLKLLLDLPRDADQATVENKWGEVVIPLLTEGLKIRFQQLVNTLVAAGPMPMEKAWRIASQIRPDLKAAVALDSAARVQQAMGSVPPFIKK